MLVNILAKTTHLMPKLLNLALLLELFPLDLKGVVKVLLVHFHDGADPLHSDRLVHHH